MYKGMDARDHSEFKEYLGTEDEELLVCGGRTMARLEKYLPPSEFLTIRVILTALIRDFCLPSRRSTTAVALAVYVMSRPDAHDNMPGYPAVLEAGLLDRHLDDDDQDDGGLSERERFNADLALVMERWSEYIADPDHFRL